MQEDTQAGLVEMCQPVPLPSLESGLADDDTCGRIIAQVTTPFQPVSHGSPTLRGVAPHNISHRHRLRETTPLRPVQHASPTLRVMGPSKHFTQTLVETGTSLGMRMVHLP